MRVTGFTQDAFMPSYTSFYDRLWALHTDNMAIEDILRAVELWLIKDSDLVATYIWHDL